MHDQGEYLDRFREEKGVAKLLFRVDPDKYLTNII